MVIDNLELDVESLAPGSSAVFFRTVRKALDGTLAGHYCVPAKRTREGDVLLGDDIMLAGSTGKALDTKVLGDNIQWVIGKVADHLKTCRLSGEKTTVIVPMNALALASKAAASSFAQACRNYDQNIKACFVVEIFNFPKGMSLSFLDEVAIVLYPFSPRYIARPNMGWDDYKTLTNCNFHGVSVDLQNKPWPDAKVKPYLEKFVLNAQANRLTTYLHGVASPSIAKIARAAGCEHLDGNLTKNN